MNFLTEYIIWSILKIFGFFVRCLPLRVALGVGRFIGTVAYYLDRKHRRQAYFNLRIALSSERTPQEFNGILKNLFKNYAQNLIELFRMPSLTPQKFKELVKIDGEENISESLKAGKGLILLAMHFGSWEMASLSSAMLGYPYKVIVKSQKKYFRLNEMLNSSRSCGGAVVLARGMGTRDFIKSLQNNEVIGMVADQGGRDGVLVPFFGRGASMSSGAIRMGLKWGVPVCFSVIVREPQGHHHLIIHKPWELSNTGDLEKDVLANLKELAPQMEDCIRRYPSEYMWFYKNWKYSKDRNILLLDDGRAGHLRQSQRVSKILQELLQEKGFKAEIHSAPVIFKSEWRRKIFAFINFVGFPFVYLKRWDFLRASLTEDSFNKISRVKADYLISCGSSLPGVNQLLCEDQDAKSIVIQKPGFLSIRRFHLVILPQHDALNFCSSAQGGAIFNVGKTKVAATYGAINLVSPEYLKEQAELLSNRFSHLKNRFRMKLGVFIGGDSRNLCLGETQIKIMIDQLKEVAEQMNVDILLTTSRRTTARVEQLLQRAFKKYPHCSLLILASQDNIPEAVGGILGLADILVVSGDSISMVSEAASSGKKTIVFSPQMRRGLREKHNKHKWFVENLRAQGFIFSTDVKQLARVIYDMSKGKIQPSILDDGKIVREALKGII